MRLRPALTLIELIIVIALVSLFILPAAYAVPRIRHRQALATSAQTLSDALKRARIYARESKDDAGWGLKSINSYEYVLEKGNRYSFTDNQKLVLEAPIVFVNYPFQVWFDQGSGDTPDAMAIRLAAPSGEEKTVLVSSTGVIKIN